MIELTDVLFYKGAISGFSRVVGYEDNSRRVVRYTFLAPETGASGQTLLFRTLGLESGAKIPLRYYIGSDPESHVNAGTEYEYTGELTLGEDQRTFTAECRVLMLPGRTYYLWVFPGEDTYGYYGWDSLDGPSEMEFTGAGFILPVVKGGAIEHRAVFAKINGQLVPCAACVKKDGKLWMVGLG